MDRYSRYAGPHRTRSTDYYQDDLDSDLDFDRGQRHRASRSYPQSPVKKGRGYSSYERDYDYDDEAEYRGRYHGYRQPSSRQLRRSIDDSDLEYSAVDRGRSVQPDRAEGPRYDRHNDGQRGRKDEYSAADRYRNDRRRDEYRDQDYPQTRREEDLGAKRSDYFMSRQDTIDLPSDYERDRRSGLDRKADRQYEEDEGRRGRSRDYRDPGHHGRKQAEHDRYRGRYDDSDSDEPQQDYEKDSPKNRPSSGQARGLRRTQVDDHSARGPIEHHASRGPTHHEGKGPKDHHAPRGPTRHEQKGPKQEEPDYSDLSDLPADYLSSSDSDQDQGDQPKNKHSVFTDKKYYKDNTKQTSDQRSDFDPISLGPPSNGKNISAAGQASYDGLDNKDKEILLPTGYATGYAVATGGADNLGFVEESGGNMKRLRRVGPIDVNDGDTGRGVASEGRGGASGGRDGASGEEGGAVTPGGVVPDITIQSVSSSASSLSDGVSVIDMTSQDGDNKVTSLGIDDADSDAASHVTSLAYKRRQSMFPISNQEMLDAIKVKYLT